MTKICLPQDSADYPYDVMLKTANCACNIALVSVDLSKSFYKSVPVGHGSTNYCGSHHYPYVRLHFKEDDIEVVLNDFSDYDPLSYSVVMGVLYITLIKW